MNPVGCGLAAPPYSTDASISANWKDEYSRQDVEHAEKFLWVLASLREIFFMSALHSW